MRLNLYTVKFVFGPKLYLNKKKLYINENRNAKFVKVYVIRYLCDC